MADPQPRHITRSQYRWLADEMRRWQSLGLIESDRSRSILAQYGDPADFDSRRSSRLFLVLMALAVLMIVGSLLLLIGYNWSGIGREMKVAMIFAAVVAAFTGSFRSYATHHPMAGHILALAASLLYGCAIWLLAQVFHIQAHYPDGMLWWAIGALLIGYAVRSNIIGLQALILFTIWTGMESLHFRQMHYAYLPMLGLIIGLAYYSQSAALLTLSGWAMACWMAMKMDLWRFHSEIPKLMALLGCAQYGLGLLHGTATRYGRAWHVASLLIILASLMPMTFTEFHRPHTYSYYNRQPLAAGNITFFWIMASVCMVATLIPFVLNRRNLRPEWPAIALGLFTFVSMFTNFGSEIYAAVVFCALTVMLAVWLIVRGVNHDRALSFFAGVLYMLVFVFARWVNLIGDMLSSAGLFMLCGLILLGTAIYWRRRPIHSPEAGHE